MTTIPRLVTLARNDTRYVESMTTLSLVRIVVAASCVTATAFAQAPRSNAAASTRAAISADDLQEIEDTAGKIPVRGERLREEVLKLSER